MSSVGWEQAAGAYYPDPMYLVVRGLMAHYVASQTQVTPKQAHEVLNAEIMGFGQVTPAAISAILDSAIERARQEAG